MTMTIIEMLVTAALVAVVWRLLRRYRARTAEARWRPSELKGAELAFAEKTFKVWRPFPLIARLDRAYRINGMLHLVELKTRGRDVVHETDVLELSAQRLAVEQETGERVSDTGYVLVQQPWPRRRSVHVVKLERASELMRLANRRQDLLAGRAVPQYAHNPGLCRKCAFRQECRPPKA